MILLWSDQGSCAALKISNFNSHTSKYDHKCVQIFSSCLQMATLHEKMTIQTISPTADTH